MRHVRVVFLVTGLSLGLTVAAWSQGHVPGESGPGKLLFDVYCVSCHGAGAEGDGPLAADLRVPPADLTRLLDKAGAFPTDRVREAIDGRFEVRSHGTREMPVWGLTFQDRSRGNDQENEVEGRIDDLVAYLRSIQVEKPGRAD